MPESVGIATKPQLPVGMLARPLGRLPAAWVAADAVYGPDPWLRAWLEGRGVGRCWASTQATTSRSLAAPGASRPALTGHLEAAGWLRLSAGAGVQGLRWWDWAHLELATPTVHGHTRWLLARRHPEDPTEVAW